MRTTPSLSLTGIHASEGIETGLWFGLVPTLATDGERGGITESGVGIGTGCEILGEGSGDGIRTGVVTGMGFNILSSGGSVIPGALPPPPPP